MGPLRCRMDRHVEVKDPSAVVRKYDKYKQSLEPDGVYGEEVDRDRLRHVIGQKRPPCLRRRFGMPHHVSAHRCLRDWYPKLEKFAVDSQRSPQHVIWLMVRISSRVAVGTLGRPAFPWRTLQVQYQRNPRRCHSTTVSGFTITSGDCDRDQERDSQTHKHRSTGLSFGLGFIR